MRYRLGVNTTRNLESILQSGKAESALLVKAVKEFILDTPIDFCIIDNGGYRTAEQQKYLYDNDTSRCDGYLTESEHQKGLAVDLVPWVNGRPTWDIRESFYLSGAFMCHCKRIGLHVTTGADWNGNGILKEDDSWDPCHFQIEEL